MTAKKKPHPDAHDTIIEQYRKMGYRAGLQDAINLVAMTWSGFANRTVRDLSEPFEQEILRRLVQKLSEHKAGW